MSVDDVATFQVDGGQMVIFRPGDTLVMQVPNAESASDDELTDIVQQVREMFGNKVEVIVISNDVGIHKVIRDDSENQGEENE